nr:hypothetical protein 348p1_00125 [Serratia grimesii]
MKKSRFAFTLACFAMVLLIFNQSAKTSGSQPIERSKNRLSVGYFPFSKRTPICLAMKTKVFTVAVRTVIFINKHLFPYMTSDDSRLLFDKNILISVVWGATER